MIVDNRIEELLNRANQTISDLPKAGKYHKYGCDLAYDIDKIDVTESYLRDRYNKTFFGLQSIEYCDYILHLSDIIDRMEAALHNTLIKLEQKEHETIQEETGDMR